MRASLDRAMRAQVPRAGAHGLVLAQVSDAAHDGAKLRLTMIFPRLLGSDVAQAEAIRDAAPEGAGRTDRSGRRAGRKPAGAASSRRSIPKPSSIRATSL